MQADKKTARIAGLLYLIVVLTGIFSLAYVPSKLIVWNDASTTVANLQSSEMLFRLSIVAGIVCYTAFLLLPLVLYQLLQHVGKIPAVAMVALSVVSVPFSLFNLVNKVNVLTLLGDANYLNAAEPGQLAAEVMTNLASYDNGIRVVSVFWGLWLFPFGYLVYRSGFLPKVLGMLLMAGCFGYLTNFLGNFLFASYRELGIGTYVALPATLGEIGICLWLVTVGIQTKKPTSI